MRSSPNESSKFKSGADGERLNLDEITVSYSGTKGLARVSWLVLGPLWRLHR